MQKQVLIFSIFYAYGTTYRFLARRDIMDRFLILALDPYFYFKIIEMRR